MALKVFISCVVGGLEAFRDAAEATLLDYAQDTSQHLVIVRSERQSATAQTSLDACEKMVAETDLVVGIYGHRYGFVDAASDLSITHLEFRWAVEKYSKPLLAFLLPGDHEAAQADFLTEFEDFRLGVFRKPVATPADMRHELYRSLHVHRARTAFEAALVAARNGMVARPRPYASIPLRYADSIAEASRPTRQDDPQVAPRLLSLLDDPARAIILVLGESGSGKTWLAEDMFVRLVDGMAAAATAPLPLFLDLSTLKIAMGKSPSEIRQLVMERLVPAAGGPDGPCLSQLAGARQAVLIADGVDEVMANSENLTTPVLLGGLLSALGHRGMLIVTSRTSIFEPLDTEALELSLATLLEQADTRKVRPIYLRPLSSADVERFLEQNHPKSGGQIADRLELTPAMIELATRPMMLALICKTVERNLATPIPQWELSIGRLWREYTSHWLNRDGWRLTFGRRSIREFFQLMALDIHNTGVTTVDVDALPHQFPEFFPAGQFSPQRSQIIGALSTATFLSSDGSGLYRFSHRSFMEYFVAERILAAVKRVDTALTLMRFPSKPTCGFLVDLTRAELPRVVAQILSMLRNAGNGITRYLMAYLLNRLTMLGALDVTGPLLDRELTPLLKVETDPVVVREIIVTLSAHGVALDRKVIIDHIRRPIPHHQILVELEQYYGDLNSGRRYLRHKLQHADASRDPLTLFYLISLTAVAEPDDSDLLNRYSASANDLERSIATSALGQLRVRPTAAGPPPGICRAASRARRRARVRVKLAN